jgi:hypothetical protein
VDFDPTGYGDRLSPDTRHGESPYEAGRVS